MKSLAVIPARGGSKRIPRKNIKEFLGKPIIAYSIKAAIESNLFDEVMVSTDDEEIATLALELGAKVPFFRSKKNSDDFATTVDVILEVLDYYKSLGIEYEYGCCIYSTAPFINTELLDRGFNTLLSNGYDSVFPVLKFGFPIQRALKIDSQNKMELFSPEHISSRSQDLTDAYHDAGQFYWFKSSEIIQKKQLYTDNTGVVVISELEAHDIDTDEDWAIAEFKFKSLLNGKA